MYASVKKCLWTLLPIALLVLVCIGLLYVLINKSVLDDGSSHVSEVDGLDKVMKTEVALIAAESIGQARALNVASAPPIEAFRAQAEVADDQDQPIDPRYTYTQHFGEMNVEKMPQASRRELPLTRDELDWLENENPVAELRRLARNANRNWTFGWILMASDTNLATLHQQLNPFNAEILGTSGRMVRVKLPVQGDYLESIAALSEVQRIGFTPQEAKILGLNGDRRGYTSEVIPLFVTLMDDDADGRWRHEMTQLGAVVGSYYQELRTYKINATRAVVDVLAATDFVLVIEPIRIDEATHDTAAPAMGVGAIRQFDASLRTFLGTTGASVPIGIIDSGLNINHLDIASNRLSICGANFALHLHENGADRQLDADEDLWIDVRGHGTHVAGTVFGNGVQTARFAGMAPGVQHIRVAKVLDTNGMGSSSQTIEGMRFISRQTGCGTHASDRVAPLIINMSLSAAHFNNQGRDFPARILDSTVWSTGQLFVVSQGNSGVEAFSNFAAGKNSLAVGATLDSGEIAAFSSHGPTADGRLSPNVVAVGMRVLSTTGGGQRGGYRESHGTSMSTPMVSGIAALLMDVAPDYKGFAALTRAQLMATAIRPEWWLTENSGFNRDNTHGPGKLQNQYGLGKVSARTAVLSLDESPGWFSGSASAALEDGEYAYFDIEVPEDASGLDVVLTWDEPPGDALVGTVLNNLDLWLDLNSDCETIACGEHSSRSKHDNVEWIFLKDPEPGTHRLKVLANAVYTAAPRAGIAWKVTRGASTATITIEADQERIEGNGEHELTLTVSADANVAAGVQLQIDCRSNERSNCNDFVAIENVELKGEDGLRSSLRDESQLALPPNYKLGPANDVKIPLGSSLPLGEIAAGDERHVAIRLSIRGIVDDPNLRLIFKSSAWNGNTGTTSVIVGNTDGPNTHRPENDNFKSAMAIHGVNGTVPIDLLYATPEAAEPNVEPILDRAAASVWFTWQAPETEQFRFHLPSVLPASSVARRDYVHVFKGQNLSSLEPITSGLWRASFRATEGDTYHIRVAGLSRSVAMNLAWGLSSRPENDDFVNALSLGRGPASIVGTTSGATLEAGEFYGAPAASTWYRWTAPDDGRWVFEATNQLVLAFTGESVRSLRLISDTPAAHADFPTREGEAYFVMVGDIVDAPEGNDFELRWFPASHSGNDSFNEAEVVNDLESQRFRVDIDYYASVEPDEPLATGVRTEWWAWDAPEDGRYTWRLNDIGEASPSFQDLLVTAFTGTALSDLELIATMGPGAPYAFALDATEGERFWIAVGLPVNHPAAHDPSQPRGELAWQKSPSNDLAINAVTLTGVSGDVAGNNAFATNERGEGLLGIGRGTVWWQFTAPTTGWFQFKVGGEGGPWSLSVVDVSSNALEPPALVANNRWQRSADEVLLNAKEGTSYQIVLGSVGGGRGGEFTLSWNEDNDPGWIRYVAQITDGQLDSEENEVQIRRPGDLAINNDGTSLFLASSLGLSVFERDTESGELVLRQLLDSELDLTRASLIWDPERRRLLVDECGNWRSFSASSGNAEQLDVRELEVQDDVGRCASFLLLDSSGTNLYRIAEAHVQQYSLTESGAVSFMNEVSLPHRIRGAVLSPNDQHMYVVTDRLLMLAISDESGLLELTEFEDMLNFDRSLRNRVLPIAISEDGVHLFVFDQLGQNAHVYLLSDSRDPVTIWSLQPFWAIVDGSHAHRCRFANVYGRPTHIEVFCPSLVFAARWNPLEAYLTGIDYISHTQGDRFNSLPLPNFDIPTGVAVSPDKKHVYLATPYAGILVFERSSRYAFF